MKFAILGGLLALLVVFPTLGAVAAATVVTVAAQPVAWGFAAGIAARPRLVMAARRWAR